MSRTMSRTPITTAAAFDTALAGTPEIIWQNALAQQPCWAPRRGPLLVVSPHPDDEVLGAGGLMRMWCAWNYPVTLVSVTDGEAAYPDWRNLKDRRRAELDRALGVLSPSVIRTVRLALADGGGEANRAALEGALSTLSANRPTLIAPYESDGHPDHEATGKACLNMACALQLPIARFPIWAWHQRHPRHFQGARFGCFALDRASHAAKGDAMACFTSQLAPGAPRVPIVPNHVLDYFRRDFEAFLL